MKRSLPRAAALGALLLRVRPAPVAVLLKTLLRVERLKVETPEGIFLADPASDFGQRLLTEKVYEPELIATLKALLRPGDSFADVGANEGYFSVLASRLVGKAGRVLAVEPQARLQPVLRQNFLLNGAANISLLRAVISDAAGSALINLAPSTNTGSSSLQQRTRYAVRRESVPAMTLETALRESGMDRLDCLKLDIEGWEYEAILGSKPLFESGRIRALTLELHDSHLQARGLSPAPIVDFLQTAGYRHEPSYPVLTFVHSSR